MPERAGEVNGGREGRARRGPALLVESAMLLAGDIGATKALIGLYAPSADRPELVNARAFTTRDHPSLESIVGEFLDAERVPRDTVQAATFGVAGPIVEQEAELTNVPWRVSAARMAAAFGIPRVTLLNDLVAMAYSVPVLRTDELAPLQAGRRVPTGNAALIAAGTGLGQALLHYVDGRFIPSPTEGGHADFAPRNAEEVALLEHVTGWFGRTDYERVLSGPGLVNIHRFTHPDGCPACDGEADPARKPSLVSQTALSGACAGCVRALRLFVSIYGAEAGNLALRSVATAGVFLGGGIAPKILPALQGGRFMDAFRAKAPMEEFVSHVPVSVILNDRAGLLGAAVHAGSA
jgi:glucokinase